MIWLNLIVVYLVWGSTYIAIKTIVPVMPPLVLVATRNFAAGGLLLGWALRAGVPALTRSHWRAATLTGLFLIVGGNASVAVAGSHVDSGILAVICGSAPLWMALTLATLSRDQPKPSTALRAARVAGLVLGFSGLLWLLSRDLIDGQTGRPDALPYELLVVAGTVTWSVASMRGRRWQTHPNPALASALSMLTGGAACCILALLRGDFRDFATTGLDAMTWTVGGAWLYLVIFGSVIAFSSYTWLLRHCDPTLVSTYAYVNPLVALGLGTWLGGEELTPDLLGAAALIVGAVALVVVAPAIGVRSARLKP